MVSSKNAFFGDSCNCPAWAVVVNAFIHSEPKFFFCWMKFPFWICSIFPEVERIEWVVSYGHVVVVVFGWPTITKILIFPNYHWITSWKSRRDLINISNSYQANCKTSRWLPFKINRVNTRMAYIFSISKLYLC